MMPTPPAGSTISVGTDGADEVIAVPYQNPGLTRYGIALFMLCWLGGWAYGWIQVGSQIMSGRANLFMLFWLVAWTVGGAFAVYALYRMLRPALPETFRMMTEGLRYDSGMPPLDMNNFNSSTRPTWGSFSPSRTQVDIDRRFLQSLRLRQTDSGNRLTVDYGATRLDLARSASEIEREWLYKVLADRYSLTPQRQDGWTGSDLPRT